MGPPLWLFWEQEGNAQYFSIYLYNQVPPGHIQIVDSINMHVEWFSQDNCYGGGRTDPNTVYLDFKQDCLWIVFDLYGVTYEQYILEMIDKLIVKADCSISEADVNESLDMNMVVTADTNSNSVTACH